LKKYKILQKAIAMPKKIRNNILYLSTFPPRECGIATFTKDLTDAMDKHFAPEVEPKILAINNECSDIYGYDDRVTQQITATDIASYTTAAKAINKNADVKLVHIQHEFGIFGGECGNNLIPFLKIVKKPIVITFHTVLPQPDKTLKSTVRFLIGKARAVIVMNELSKKILEEEYGADTSKITLIPHGIPQVTFDKGGEEKRKLGIEGRIVLSTFGLLDRGKGIEHAIRALPELVKRYPRLLYLVIGATHPAARRHDGESYRNFLVDEVEKLGLKNNVAFYNNYASLEEIVRYLKATDIYLCTGLDRNQSVSGTLSYALGCGRPVISTNSSYARSIVTPEKGILVEPQNSEAIAKALLRLIEGKQLRNRMAKNAYIETRHMTWPNVALAHFELYQNYTDLPKKAKLPAVSLKHLKTLTDSFGVIQFAKHTVPDRRSGYCVDDNARAMIVASMHWVHTRSKLALDLLSVYLDFVAIAQKPDGVFVNFIASKNNIEHEKINEDAQGRAIWALGYLLSQRSLPARVRKRAKSLFRKAMPMAERIKSPRAMAFAIIGLYFYGKDRPGSRCKKTLELLASSQMRHFVNTASRDWVWFEDYLTYSNSKLPEAFFYAYLATDEKAYLDVAEKSLGFLVDITFDKEYFSPIGQNKWYFRKEKRAYFDQQPEDASSMVQTLLIAYQVTKNIEYKKRALQAFLWFLGKNHLNQMVYDELTGGCCDGLGEHSLNVNQGAESTISYLMARLSIEGHT